MSNPPYPPPGQPRYPGGGPQPYPGGQPGWGGPPNQGWQPGPEPHQWAGQQPPSQKNRNLLLVGGLVIVLLIGILAYVVVNRESGGPGPTTGPTPTSPQTSQDPGADGAAASRQVMTDLLTALSEGRASDALALIDSTGMNLAPSELLLTDQALAGNVGNFTFAPELQQTQQGNRYTYTTEVTVAGETRTVAWKVAQDASGQWLAAGADVLGTMLFASDVHTVVNGVLVGPEIDQLKVLPGGYHFGSHLTLLRFPEEQSYKAIFGGGAATFSAALVMQPWVPDAVIGHLRWVIDSCAASGEMPGACHWEVKLSNGDVTSGTVRWRVDPADPAASAVLPTSWLASSGYKAVVMLSYNTTASGDCWLWEGGSCYFVDAVNERRTRFEIDLSGAEAVISVL